MQLVIYLLMLFSALVTPLSATCSTLSLTLSSCSVPGTSVDSYGVTLTLSNPSQFLCVVPSTVVNSTLLIGSSYCQNYENGTSAQCESLSGNTFDIGAAGASYNASTPGAVLGSNPVWSEISSQALLAGNTSLFLPPDDVVPSYPIGIITGGDHQNAGHLGLATDSQFLQVAIENGLISQKGFGLDAGSQSIADPRPGKLVLGGYDQASMPQLVPPSVYSIGAPSDSERNCPLQVTITQFTLRFPLPGGNSTDYNLTEAGINVPACVEPYDNLIRLPPTLLENLQQKTGWSANTKGDPDLLIVEPGLLYPQLMGFNGSFIIKLDGYGGQVEIPNEELSHPLRGIAANGTRVLNNNLTELNVFHEAPLLSTAVLGKVFLSQVYLVVDYNKSEFRLAPSLLDSAFSDVVPLNSSSAICLNSAGSSQKPNHLGAILGASIGGGIPIALAVVAVLLRCCWPEQFTNIVNRICPACWSRSTRNKNSKERSTLQQGVYSSQDKDTMPKKTAVLSQPPANVHTDGRKPPFPDIY